MNNKLRYIIGGICIVVGLLLIFQRDIRVAYHERGFLSVQAQILNQAYADPEEHQYLVELTDYHGRSLVGLGELLRDKVELKLPPGEKGAWLNDDLSEFMEGEKIVLAQWSLRSDSGVVVEAIFRPDKQEEWEGLKRKWKERVKGGGADEGVVGAGGGE